jgi:hypothetical protein
MRECEAAWRFGVSVQPDTSSVFAPISIGGMRTNLDPDNLAIR